MLYAAAAANVVGADFGAMWWWWWCCLLVLSTEPILYDATHSRVPQNSLKLYPEDIKWLMNEQIPVSFRDKLWSYRFDFEIRSEQAYFDDKENAEIFEKRVLEMEDSLFAIDR